MVAACDVDVVVLDGDSGDAGGGGRIRSSASSATGDDVRVIVLLAERITV